MTQSSVCLAVGLGLAAATLTGTLAGPAYGQDNGNQRHQAPRYAPMHRAPPPQYNNGYYYNQPNVYYSAPPVFVAPPVYYEQPAPLLMFNFPLVVR